MIRSKQRGTAVEWTLFITYLSRDRRHWEVRMAHLLLDVDFATSNLRGLITKPQTSTPVEVTNGAVVQMSAFNA